MVADGIRDHEEQQQTDGGVCDSEQVEVAASPVEQRGAPAQRERDGHEKRVGRVREGKEQRSEQGSGAG